MLLVKPFAILWAVCSPCWLFLLLSGSSRVYAVPCFNSYKYFSKLSESFPGSPSLCRFEPYFKSILNWFFWLFFYLFSLPLAYDGKGTPERERNCAYPALLLLAPFFSVGSVWWTQGSIINKLEQVSHGSLVVHIIVSAVESSSKGMLPVCAPQCPHFLSCEYDMLLCLVLTSTTVSSIGCGATGILCSWGVWSIVCKWGGKEGSMHVVQVWLSYHIRLT